jgi:hypothetical protein
MATIFPTSPAPQVNDEYQGYRYNGVSWDIIGIDLTADYQLKITGVSDTEIGHLDGVTSSIQTQINSKLSSSTATTSGSFLRADGTNWVASSQTLTLSGNTTIGSSTHTVAFATSSNTSVTLPESGTLAILGNNTFTGSQTLRAGTATAGTAPLYLTPGTNLTTAAAGAMEFDGTNLYFSPSTTRRTFAFLDSPAFTGTASAPTAAVDTNTTQLATTAFVLNQAGDTSPIVNGTANAGTSERYSRANHVHPTDTSRSATSHDHDYLPLAGGTMTGQLNLADNVILNLGVNGGIDLDSGGYIDFSNDDKITYDDSTNTYSFGADGNSSGGAILANEFLTTDNAGSATDPAFASPQGTSGMYFVGGSTITGIRFTVNGTHRYSITSSGGAPASSIRGKDNIETYAVPTEDLLNIRTISYHPKGDERDVTAFGVIAEELDEVPSLRIFINYEEDGSPSSVQYDRIALALINVVKEQQERIDLLEQRLTELENHG